MPMPPVSVVLGRETVQMLVDVCSSKTSYISKSWYTASVCQAATDKHISFSCANVPCMKLVFSAHRNHGRQCSTVNFRDSPGVFAN